MEDRTLLIGGAVAGIAGLIVSVGGTVGGLASAQAPVAWFGAAIVIAATLVFLTFLFLSQLGMAGASEQERQQAGPAGASKGRRRMTLWLSRYLAVVAVAFVLVTLVGVVGFVKVVHETNESYPYTLEFTSGSTQSEWINMSGSGQIVFNWSEVSAPGQSYPQIQVTVTGPHQLQMFSGFTNYDKPGYGGIVATSGAFEFNLTMEPVTVTTVYLLVQTAAFTSAPIWSN
jgi:hypothetical protein